MFKLDVSTYSVTAILICPFVYAILGMMMHSIADKVVEETLSRENFAQERASRLSYDDLPKTTSRETSALNRRIGAAEQRALTMVILNNTARHSELASGSPPSCEGYVIAVGRCS